VSINTGLILEKILLVIVYNMFVNVKSFIRTVCSNIIIIVVVSTSDKLTVHKKNWYFGVPGTDVTRNTYVLLLLLDIGMLFDYHVNHDIYTCVNIKIAVEFTVSFLSFLCLTTYSL
jgi:hypothetical protein